MPNCKKKRASVGWKNWKGRGEKGEVGRRKMKESITQMVREGTTEERTRAMGGGKKSKVKGGKARF